MPHYLTTDEFHKQRIEQSRKARDEVFSLLDNLNLRERTKNTGLRMNKLEDILRARGIKGLYPNQMRLAKTLTGKQPAPSDIPILKALDSVLKNYELAELKSRRPEVSED